MGAFVQNLEKKLVFVTGKGGVGKSTVTLLLARHLSSLGRNVLVVELGQRSSLGALVEADFKPEIKPQQTPYSFSYSLMGGAACLSQYVNHFVKVAGVADIFLNNRFMKTLIPLAPGLDDLAILGQLTADIRQHGPLLGYDHIIVDAPSSGAFLSMLKAPQYLSGVVDRGPLHTQSRGIIDVLNDSQKCHFIFVTLLERFPMDELAESTKFFQDSFSTSFSVLVNRVLPEVSTQDVKPDGFKIFLETQITSQNNFLQDLKNQFGNILKLNLMTQSLSQTLKEQDTCPFSQI